MISLVVLHEKLLFDAEQDRVKGSQPSLNKQQPIDPETEKMIQQQISKFLSNSNNSALANRLDNISNKKSRLLDAGESQVEEVRVGPGQYDAIRNTCAVK